MKKRSAGHSHGNRSLKDRILKLVALTAFVWLAIGLGIKLLL